MNLKNNCSRTGAYILIDSLIQNGVEHIFGYPGGAILPIYDLGDGSSYDLQHLHSHTPPYKARWQYHCTHIEQLKTLYLITRNPLFETYYLRFKAYLSGQFTAPL